MKITDNQGNVTEVAKDQTCCVMPDGRAVKFLSDKALRAKIQREIDARLAAPEPRKAAKMANQYKEWLRARGMDKPEQDK